MSIFKIIKNDGKSDYLLGNSFRHKDQIKQFTSLIDTLHTDTNKIVLKYVCSCYKYCSIDRKPL